MSKRVPDEGSLKVDTKSWQGVIVTSTVISILRGFVNVLTKGTRSSFKNAYCHKNVASNVNFRVCYCKLPLRCATELEGGLHINSGNVIEVLTHQEFEIAMKMFFFSS